MTDDKAAAFAGTLAEFYDRYLVPFLFAPYAEVVAGRAKGLRPRRVLETAAGTGVVTEALSRTLPSDVVITATDLNLPMIERGKARPGMERVVWQQADAMKLPFSDAAFDLIVCQFGVMFFPDKDKAYREAYRVLGYGGRYHFNVWDSFDFNPFARISHDAIGGFFNCDAPAFFTVPFGYHRIDEIKSSLLAAGFTELAVHVLKIDKMITTARQFAEGLVLGNPIIDEIRARGTTDSAPIIAAVTETLQSAFGEHPARMPLQAIVFSALKR